MRRREGREEGNDRGKEGRGKKEFFAWSCMKRKRKKDNINTHTHTHRHA